MVRVTPGKLPAKVIVAPNSPSARAKQSTAPALMPGATSGSVTRRKTVQRDAPSVAAAASYRRAAPRRGPPTGPPRARRRAARRGGVLVPAVGSAQGPLDRQHEERQRDEGLGDDHGCGGERQGDPEPA